MGIDFGEPVPRTLLHRRRVHCDGYARADGLFDIEARLLDTRTHVFPVLVGEDLPANEPVHQMGLRVTVDRELLIRSAEPLMVSGPVPECPNIADAYMQLVGLKIGKGFSRAVKTMFAGRSGCSHMTEMLVPLATVAMQTVWAQQMVERERGGTALDASRNPDQRPALLDSCHSYRSDGEVIRLRWPKFYTGSKN